MPYPVDWSKIKYNRNPRVSGRKVSSSMPVSRKVYKRKNYKKKVRQGQTAVNLRSVGLPKAVITKLKFNYTGVITSAANAPVYIQFGMNDPYAPPGSSVDQPNFFDQLCAANLYQRFTCYRGTYRIRFWNQSAGSEAAQYFVWYGNSGDSATIIARATTNALMYEEREQSTAYGGTLTEPGSTQATKMHTGTVLPTAVFGASKSKVYDEDAFAGSFSASPSNRCVLLVGAAGDPTTVLGSVIRYEIQIVYDVKFWDLANSVTP